MPISIAVAIPCYNEAAAIEAVVAEWRAALPEAEIVVFDNNSTDDTARLAIQAGARVVPVPDQGKGHAVQAIFRELRDRDAVVMIDGDGTYPAAPVRALLEPLLDGRADTVVGARRPIQKESMNPTRAVGNLLINAAFRLLIGRGNRDLLSGYRLFGRRFLDEVSPRSSGFEIETELAARAVIGRLRTIEIPVPYHPRAAGTESKLRAFRDGKRILRAIVLFSAFHRPYRLVVLMLMVCLIASLYFLAR